jgi:hypothetical protein
MSEIEGVLQHPILDDLHTLQDAVYLSGLEEALSRGLVYDGKLKGAFTPWDQADSTYPVSRLDVLDIELETRTVFAFAPPADIQNPMYMQEVDTVDPTIVSIIPIIARVLIKPKFGIPVEDIQGNRDFTESILLNFTPEDTVIAYDESLGFDPSRGEFDDKTYRAARRVLNQFSHLQRMLEFAA